MAYKYLAPLIAVLALSLDLTSAHAGPCPAKIKQFESAVRNSKPGPGVGPSLPQSIGAQLSYQPTPESVKTAEQRAQAGSRQCWHAPKSWMRKANEPPARRRLPTPSSSIFNDGEAAD